MSVKIVLASKSPRRSELLGFAGIDFEVVDSNVDEDRVRADSAEQLAIKLAELKAQAVSEKYPTSLILAADTIVVCDASRANVGIKIGESIVLGKPKDKQEASAMIKALAGCQHQVITAFSFKHNQLAINYSQAIETNVTFREIESDELNWYVNTNEPYDKAGGYGAQGHAQSFISSISGSYSNVIGLPLSEVVVALREIQNKYFKG